MTRKLVHLKSGRLGALLVVGALSLGAAAFARTRLHVGSMTIDGQTVRDVTCELDTGGLGAVMKVVGALSKQKKSLDGCAPAGAAYRVKWTWAGGKATAISIAAASDQSGSACVAKALQLTENSNSGDCEATVLVGKDLAAAKAADALAPAAPSAPAR